MTAKEAEHILIHMGDYIEYDEDYGYLFKPKLVDASVRAIRALRAEVVHGRWVKHLEQDELLGDIKYYTCSECDWIDKPCYNYCPNCGAKMDLE